MEKISERESQKREDAGVRKGSKAPKLCGSRGWKSRLATAGGAQPAGQMRDAVVGLSTYPSQNVQSTPALNQFWTIRCRFVWDTNRQVDRQQIDSQIPGQVDRQKGTQIHRKIHRSIYKSKDRYIDRYIGKKMDRKTDGQHDKLIDKKKYIRR